MQEGVKWWAISPHNSCMQGVFGVTTKQQDGLKCWAISPHQACMQEVFGMTTKHERRGARRGELVGHFISPSMQARSLWGQPSTQEGVKCWAIHLNKHASKDCLRWWAISPRQACMQAVFGVTTKHSRRGEMVGHFTSPSMQARSVCVQYVGISM